MTRMVLARWSESSEANLSCESLESPRTVSIRPNPKGKRIRFRLFMRYLPEKNIFSGNFDIGK